MLAVELAICSDHPPEPFMRFALLDGLALLLLPLEPARRLLEVPEAEPLAPLLLLLAAATAAATALPLM